MTVILYTDKHGNCPFSKWLWALRDTKTQARIEARIHRLRLGHLGDFKHLGCGLIELRLNFGSGYRLYCSQIENTIYVLLCGGDKSTQRKDTQKAKQFLSDYLEQLQ